MKPSILIPALAAAFALTAAASAQTGPAAVEPKINQVIVYGDQPCPLSTEDEIVVCARDSEEFRIPAKLRGNPNAPANQAWGVRATQIEYVGRSGLGTCSATGADGASGCFNKLVQQARAERKQGDGTGSVGLIEAARQERLGQIDEKSDAIEARVKAEEAQKKAAKDVEKNMPQPE
ncbi:hypothetical protein [Sphingobium boeckii]|uniref:Uncharacterized protein n=1 Tax=Sphingobium boeckii TaxID=1082345 RepID=A0A7W9AIJ2_9SPHN|nr:hypothetical protein [Sphingobium boeckii]MBB5686109.1 hypothetical protein [Sphingobium boeckii]